MTLQFSDMTSSSNFFDVLFLLPILVTDPSFTGSGVMKIFFYKGLTRNPEIANTPASEFFPISGDCGASKRYQIWHECL